jgi:glutamine amidotransferase
LAAVGAEVFTPGGPGELADAAAIIVPGVGHFDATRVLDWPWVQAVLDRLSAGRPLLGICLGMQWLYEGSEEAADLPGLGILSGRCYRLKGRTDAGAPLVKVPHVGWNALARLRAAPILEGVDEGAQVYFTHSYVAPLTDATVAATEHGERFASVVQRGVVAGVQFHPEKSGDVGLRILRNFLQMAAVTG